MSDLDRTCGADFEEAVREGERALVDMIAGGARASHVSSQLAQTLERLFHEAPCVVVNADPVSPRIVAAGPRAQERGCVVGGEPIAPLASAHRRVIIDDEGRMLGAILVALPTSPSPFEIGAIDRLLGLTIIVLRRERTERSRRDTVTARSDPPSARAIRTRVAGLAHEIRNALFGVAATLDAFDERFHVSSEHERYVEVIRGQVARVAVLMQGLLEQGDPSTLRTLPTSAREAVDAAVAACQPRADTRDVTISVTIEAGLPPLRLDRKHLSQILRELTCEAVELSPAGAIVEIVVRRSDESGGVFAICDVRDEGPRWAHVDDDDLRATFFTRREGHGACTLAAARRLVVAAGGTLEAGNRAERGAIVRLRIPL
jgi:signal transduction histidine kinase